MKQFIRKADIILFIVLVAIGLAASAALTLSHGEAGSGAKVVIESGGDLYARYPLTEDRTVVVPAPKQKASDAPAADPSDEASAQYDYYNVVVISGGTVSVTEASWKEAAMTQSPRKASGRKSLSASFIARVGLMATLALIFSYVEAIIPYNPGVPGIKLGIANVVTVVALYKFGNKDAAAVSIIRVVLAGLLFNGLFGMLYALAGAAVSLAGMILLKKTGLFSVTGVSMAAGVLHNLGQLLVAAALIEDLRIFFYFPVLMFSGIAAGILVGIASTLVLRALR